MTIVREHDRAKALGIPQVSVIVVAGDVVQGCGLATVNYADELRSQYVVAAELLRQLTDELLSGDFKRLALVPGNHDVCWNTAVSAMKVALLPSSPTPTASSSNEVPHSDGIGSSGSSIASMTYSLYVSRLEIHSESFSATSIAARSRKRSMTTHGYMRSRD